MNSKEKFWYLVGPVVMNISFISTCPILHIYFASHISPRIIAFSDMLAMVLGIFVNRSILVSKLQEWYRSHFLLIIIVDVISMYVIYFFSVEFPEVRFIGMAITNAISTTLWVTVMRSSLNRVLSGDKLTEWQAYQKSVELTASLIGGCLAMIFIDVPVEICLIIQCFGNTMLGITDFYAFKLLSKKEKIDEGIDILHK